MKKCCRCKRLKPTTNFWKSPQKKDGLDPRCKACSSTEKKASNEKIKEQNPEAWQRRRRAYVKRYKDRHPERVKLQYRKRNLQKKFGISLDQYNEILVSQKGKCAICKKLPTTKLLAVDHCAVSGKVRALLCGKCNTGIGLFDHSQTKLKQAIKYLNYHA